MPPWVAPIFDFKPLAVAGFPTLNRLQDAPIGPVDPTNAEP